MLKTEFEKMTGIYPTDEFYREIEKRYINEDTMDKSEFCRRYKENVNGIAKEIQKEAQMKEWKTDSEWRETIRKKDEEIKELKKKIADLEGCIDELEGWEPYEVSEITQEEYEKLRSEKTTEELSDEKAKEWISERFGFRKDKIRILREIPLYQKEKRGIIRNNGSVERPPVHNAYDWNYARFDVAGLQYEVVNDELHKYYD